MRAWLGLLLLSVACSQPPAKVPHYPPLVRSDDEAELVRTGRLPSDVRPLHYALTLDVDPAQARFSGEARIAIALDRTRSVLYLHGKGLRVQSAELASGAGRQQALPLQVRTIEGGLLALASERPITPGLGELVLRYDAPFGTRLTGLYKVEHGGLPYVFTQHEPISARETFPGFDEPRFKTPYAITLRVPRGQVAIANTGELARSALPDGRDEVRFKESAKLPSYLVALAVGPFDVVEAPVLPASVLRDHALPLRAISVRGRGADLAYALRETPRYVTRLEEYTGIGYPYDKLDLIAVPDFAAGAMENAGAITFRDTLLLVPTDADEGLRRRFNGVNAHELAHQWFGNLVTMPWWDDVWLNESFATWLGTRTLDELEPSYHAQRDELRGVHGAMDMDSEASARRIREPVSSEHDIDNAFDGITYEKGGAVLRMFEGYLGETTFRDALRGYLSAHAFGLATADDLVTALVRASGDARVGEAFRDHLTHTGVPSVISALDCAISPAVLRVSQARYVPLGASLDDDGGVLLPVCARYGRGAESASACTLLPPHTESALPLPLPSGGCPDFVHPNADARGYYRYAIDAAGLAKLLAQGASLTPLERSSLVANVDAAMRSGALSAELGLAALFSMLADPERSVLEAALDALRGVREALVPDAQLPAFRKEIAQRLRPRLAALGVLPKPGSAVSAEDKLLRATLVRALAVDAEEPALLHELSGYGQRLLAEQVPPAELPKELYGAALFALVQRGHGEAVALLEARLEAEQDGFLRGRLLSALAQSPHPGESERILALSLSGKLRVNERVAPVMGQLGRRETRAQAYAFFKARFDALAQAVTGHGGSAMLSALGVFCSAADADDVQASFGARAEALLGGPRELAQALDAVRSCAAFSDAQRPSATRLLAH